MEQEKELIKKAKKDPEIFGKLYEKYYSQIFGYILKRVGNLEIAQDITSETFFKALKNLWCFHFRNISLSVYPVGSRGLSFGAWLYRIASNEIANFFRKNKYKPISLEKIPEPITVRSPSTEILEAEEELKKHQEFLKIQEKISQLPIIYQEVIALRFFEKKRIKEIAEILGKKEGTIKSLIHRGLEKLKEFME